MISHDWHFSLFRLRSDGDIYQDKDINQEHSNICFSDIFISVFSAFLTMCWCYLTLNLWLTQRQHADV